MIQRVRNHLITNIYLTIASQTVYYVLLFIFLAMAWLKSNYPPFGHSINACRIAILLSFVAIFCLAACTGLAFLRYQSGTDSSQFMTEEDIKKQQEQYYVQGENVEYNTNSANADMYAGAQW